MKRVLIALVAFLLTAQTALAQGSYFYSQIWDQTSGVYANVTPGGRLQVETTVPSGIPAATDLQTINGITAAVGNGVSGTGVLRVTLASDSTGHVIFWDGVRSANVTAAGAVQVDGSGVTQPVSGTFWQATQPVSGTFWQATQPVSGTVAATQSGTWTVQPGNTANTTAWKVDGSAVTQPISAVSLPTHAVTQSGTWNIGAVTTLTSLDLAQGSTTSGQTGPLLQTATTTAAPTYTTAKTNPLSTTTAGALRVDASGTTQPVSGTVTANQGGTWTVQPGNTANTTAWKVDGSAVTQPISAVSLPTHAVTQSGTWNVGTVTTLTSLDLAQGSTTLGQTGPMVQTATTTAAPTYTTAKTNPLSTTTAGALRVDNSAVTQPVSGTLGATQSGTWTVQPGNTANTTAWKVDGSAVTQPVSGTVTANQGGTWTVQPGNTANTTAWKVDGSAVTQPVSISGAQSVNQTQVNGVAVSVGNGATDTGTQRVTMSNDSTGIISQTATTVPAATTMQNAAVGNGNGTNLTTTGYGTVVLNITASVAMSGGTTVNFEVSPDAGTTWLSVLGTQVGTTTTGTSTTTTGSWQFNVAGYGLMRARISAYSAGTITIKGYPTVIAIKLPSAPGGSGTVTSVTFTGDGVIDSTTPSTAVTTAGTVTATAKTQTANTVLAGPTSGGVVAPTFRALVGADLPNPSSTTLGGVQSLASVASKWINTISTSGVPSATQPAFSDLSGTATAAQVAPPPSMVNARISGVSGTAAPVNTTSIGQTLAGSIYLVPYNGNQVSVYNGSNWITDTISTAPALAIGTAEYITNTTASVGASKHMVCSDGTDVWYATGTNKIGKLTVATGQYTEYATTSNCTNVCLGVDSKIWYSTGTVKIGKISLDGTGMTEYTTTTLTIDVAPGPADGNTWYIVNGAKIGKIATGGTGNTEFATTSTCTSICLGLDNLLWYGTSTTKIGKCTTTGTITEYATTTVTNGGVCAGPADGNTWYGTSTTKIGKIATGGTGNTEYTTTSNTSSVVADGTNVWYGVTAGGKIGKCTTAGTVTEYATTTAGLLLVGIGPSNSDVWYINNATARIGSIATSIGSESATGVYDIWVRDVSGTLTLDSTVWTNTTTRATALSTQNGVPVKSGDATRRYVGTVYIPGSTGSAADTQAERFIWNNNNRVDRALFAQDPTASWTYTSQTIHAADGNTTDGQGRVSLVIGVSEDAIDSEFVQDSSGTGSAQRGAVAGVGVDSTSTASVFVQEGFAASVGDANVSYHVNAVKYRGVLPVGLHYLQALEANISAANAWTYYGTNAAGGVTSVNSYLTGGLRN